MLIEAPGELPYQACPGFTHMVSGGTGPIKVIWGRFVFCSVNQGINQSCSSVPNCPSSPLWGFKPEITILGFSIPQLVFKNSTNKSNFKLINSGVRVAGTWFKGIWVVAKRVKSRQLVWGDRATNIIPNFSTPAL